LLSRTIQQQGHMVENIPTQYAVLCLDQQIPASEGMPQEKQLHHHDGREAPTPVEAHQFVTLIGQ
jgi:hypothetical protein